MKFVSARDFRNNSSKIWKQLAEQRERVITNHGKPVAIVNATDEDSFEQSLKHIRQARAINAVKSIQEQSLVSGTGRLNQSEIDNEIAIARKKKQQCKLSWIPTCLL